MISKELKQSKLCDLIKNKEGNTINDKVNGLITEILSEVDESIFYEAIIKSLLASVIHFVLENPMISKENVKLDDISLLIAMDKITIENRDETALDILMNKHLVILERDDENTVSEAARYYNTYKLGTIKMRKKVVDTVLFSIL